MDSVDPVWTVAAAVAGIVAAVASIVAVILTLRQLRLAKEEASLHPKLEVSFQDIAFHYRPPNPGSWYVQAAILFTIENTGRSVANNVRCEFSLDEQRLELSELHGLNRPFEEQRLGPASPRVHPVQVGIREYGPTEARYRCVCDEVGKTEGVVEFNVPEKDQE